jgi:hypothetical protein
MLRPESAIDMKDRNVTPIPGQLKGTATKMGRWTGEIWCIEKYMTGWW